MMLKQTKIVEYIKEPVINIDKFFNLIPHRISFSIKEQIELEIKLYSGCPKRYSKCKFKCFLKTGKIYGFTNFIPKHLIIPFESKFGYNPTIIWY